ncbi:unnamed protein product [Lampetra fluviatilis]
MITTMMITTMVSTRPPQQLLSRQGGRRVVGVDERVAVGSAGGAALLLLLCPPQQQQQQPYDKKEETTKEGWPLTYMTQTCEAHNGQDAHCERGRLISSRGTPSALLMTGAALNCGGSSNGFFVSGSPAITIRIQPEKVTRTVL